MKFYTAKPKLKRDERKELEDKLTTLDKRILESCKLGRDLGSIKNECRPYPNKYGLKIFPSCGTVDKAVSKLEKLGVLIRR